MSDFIEKIKQRARVQKKRIVLPETDDPRVLDAAQMLLKEKICDVVLLGNLDAIRQLSSESRLTGAIVIDPQTSMLRDEFAEKLFELRNHKGMTIEKAREQLLNPVVFGMMLVHVGMADGLVAGAVNSTPNVLRPALQILGTKANSKLVSAFFMMIVPNCKLGHRGTFLFADSGLNENPTPEQLVEIAGSSASSFRLLANAEPVVAMTSYSTYGSAKSPLTEKMIQATALAKERFPELRLDGELQIDAALCPAVAAKKAPGSPVKGEANVLIYPTLDVGNIAYKLVQYLGNAEAYGPLLQGIAKPVNDLSRGCSAEDIVGVAAITAVQAQETP